MKINGEDFEKFELGMLLNLTVFTILGMYIWKNTIDANLIYLATILVSAFVARKGLKYHYAYGQLNSDSTDDGTTNSTTNGTTNSTTNSNIQK